MHPFGWMLKYFLMALLGAITADKTIDMVAPDKVGEPEGGLFFSRLWDAYRGNGSDS